MRVKKFEAKTMKEALQMVKNELGPDAVILAAKDNRKFGLAGEASVEVTAAVSESTLQRKKFAESRLTTGDRERFTNSDARAQRHLIDKMVDSRERQNREDETAEQRRNHRITAVSYIDIPDEDEMPRARREAKQRQLPNRQPISRSEIERAILSRIDAEKMNARAAQERALGRRPAPAVPSSDFENDENDSWSMGQTRDAVSGAVPLRKRGSAQANGNARTHASELHAESEPSAQAKERIRLAAKEAFHNNPFFDEDKRAARDARAPLAKQSIANPPGNVLSRATARLSEAFSGNMAQAPSTPSQQASQNANASGDVQVGSQAVSQAVGAISVDGRAVEIETLRTEISRLQTALDGFQKVPQTFTNMHPGADFGVPYDFSFMFQKLTEAGVTVDNTVEILQAAQKEIDPVQAKKKQIIDAWVARFFLSQVQINPNPFQGRVHLFVGGSGCGKTSTLVKMASQLVVREKKRVAILTTDAFKVGAVDQLKIYCQILNVPFAVIRNRKDWEWVLNQLGPMDHILVDFPGLQLRDLEEIHVFKSLLPPEGVASQSHLCVAATTKDGDAYEIAKRYRVADYNDLIVTNLDQSTQHGIIYNVQRKTGKPLHSFGIGNRIPEDFELASKERVLDLIFRLTKFKKESRA